MLNPFANVEVGDSLVRMLGGKIPILVTVERIGRALIYCVGGWRFSRTNGAEIDEDLGWNEWRITGSYLLAPPPKHETVCLQNESGSLYVIDYARRTWRRESNIALVRIGAWRFTKRPANRGTSSESPRARGCGFSLPHPVQRAPARRDLNAGSAHREAAIERAIEPFTGHQPAVRYPRAPISPNST